MTNTNDIKISYIDYSINTRSLDIFFIGCTGSCIGCCNPELKDWNTKGIKIIDATKYILNTYNDFNRLIDCIFLVGGDPVDVFLRNKKDFKYLLANLQLHIKKPIFLFTRHQLEDIPELLKDCVDYIKTGPYIPELTTDNNIQFGIKLATSNQKIYKKYNKEWRLENELDN